MKFGLIGETLKHSLSPQIHQCIFAAAGLSDSQYDLLEIKQDKLADGLKKLCTEYTGMNVTIPYKVDVMPFLKDISSAAKRIGAINTIHVRPEGLYGYNTDYIGFGRSLENAGISIKNKPCIVLGTGGAARAIIQYLVDHADTKVTVVSRTPHNLSGSFAQFSQERELQIIGFDDLEKIQRIPVIINCTPAGMYPKMAVSPVTEAVASRSDAIVDLIYNPKDTLLLQYGRRYGAQTLNGLYMLVAQAVVSEEIWLGKTLPGDMVDRIIPQMEKFI